MGFEFDREQQAELRYIGADSDIDRISCKGYDVNVLSGGKPSGSVKVLMAVGAVLFVAAFTVLLFFIVTKM